MKRKLSLAEMEPIAQEATRKALKDRDIPESQWKEIVLGKGYDGEYGIFELYIPGSKPEDAQIISETKVHRISGEVDVNIFI